jgi:hypothetical protein
MFHIAPPSYNPFYAMIEGKRKTAVSQETTALFLY